MQGLKTNPLTGTGDVRKRRNRQPTMISNGDSTIIKSKGLGSNIVLVSSSGAAAARWYVPGVTAGLANGVGPLVVGYYATGKFLPGTVVRYEPTVSPVTGGRGFIGFTDNPEIIATITNLYSAYLSAPSGGTYAAYSNAVKGIGNLVSFPAWQEYEAVVPTRLRRKRFDVNSDATLNAVDVLDRSCQVAMFACFDGFGAVDVDVVIGSMWYMDVVDVEGLSATST